MSLSRHKEWVIISAIFALSYCIVRSQKTDIGFLDVPINPRLAATGEIFANATCGTTGREDFCKLVDHVKDVEKVEHCDYCDAQIIEKRHPIIYAINGFENWWQSPSLARGLEYHNVDIVLNLRQIYQIHWIIIKAANAPRPGNWILEKSVDGKTFTPWIYFASSVEQCRTVYNAKSITERPEPTLAHDEEVFCSTFFSKTRPVENGEIHISLTRGRPGSTKAPLPTKLIEFMSAQYIRLRLQKILTLFGDRMVLKDDIDSSVYRRYFYSIKDISVGGRCICYNHATTCIPQAGGMLRCECMHNTCGDHCEKCCPMYNQKLWQPEKPCEECNCHNHASRCIYNQTVANLQLSLNKKNKYEGGGQCVDCRDNTAGINCQSCVDGYFRPSNVPPSKKNPCIQCNCKSIGSTGSCVPDDSKIGMGLFPGKCICLPGFTGDDCNECTTGFRRINYAPYCIPCPCAIEGSTRKPYSCYAPCNCKANVDEWSKCSKCKPGYYNLQVTNPKGCSECFCFGIARKCKSSQLGAKTVSMMKGWKITNIDGDKVIDPTMTREGFPVIASFTVHQSMKNDEIFYWSAPREYLGNLITAYGSPLSYIIGVNTDGTSPSTSRPGYEVIIEGDGYRINFRRPTLTTEYGRPQILAVLLNEATPWVIAKDPTGRMTMDKRTVMSVLANVTRILIRGHYVSNQVIGELRNVTLIKGDPNSPTKLKSVEQCECPPGYAGTSCETCAPGFRRVTSDRYQAVCVPCDCNGHGDKCDPVTGQCQDCKDNTAGTFCDKCARGFYGNAKGGTPFDCKPCECPVAGRSLAESCVADPLNKGRHICVNCITGYTGERCGQCQVGYYGDPMKNMPCRKCDCNGNANRTRAEWCNRDSGECVCKFPMKGRNCEQCVSGFYGTAKNGDCKACECSPYGSKDITCSPSGQCMCREHYTSKTCGQCVKGRGNIAKGCPYCNCNPMGTDFSSTICDPVSGKCKCKPGVGAIDCSRCADGHYKFTPSGCTACKCFPKGSKSPKCDQATGKCDCGKNVIGDKCGKCRKYHFWNPGTPDCAICDCKTGAKSRTCDMNNGQCDCQKNVIGRRCDKCKQGYWGLSKDGCQKCPTCPKGHICSPVDGRCICPPLTEGDSCQRCVSHAYGYNKTAGCKLCNCSVSGTTDAKKCDPKTGQCACKPYFLGRQCNKCVPGYYNVNKCTRCQCDPKGTIMSTNIGSDLYECSLVDGRCICKPNVKGLTCDSCKDGTFGLTASYGKGCFACYCSGLTNKCSRAKGWVLQSFSQTMDIVHKSSNTGNILSIVTLSTKPYERKKWDMSGSDPLLVHIPTLKGDLTTLYGSKILDVTARCEPTCGRQRQRSSFLGEAVLFSWERYIIVLDPKPLEAYHQSIPGGSTQDKYPVHILEKYWRPIKDGDRLLPPNYMKLNRQWFMFMLSNVTSFFIRATTANVKPAAISVTLDFHLPTNDTSAVGPVVNSIEKCECPKEYSGLSCQLPAKGYFGVPRVPPPLPPGNNITGFPGSVVAPGSGSGTSGGGSGKPGSKVGSTGSGTEDGLPKPPTPGIRKCECNGKTDVCDPRTGRCMGCKDNTEGASCEKCIPGYYGNSSQGIECRPCECPSKTKNFAISCTLDKLNGFICNCKKGYMGARCESCSPGYFGINGKDGVCKPCNCSKEGSVDTACNEKGQCKCYKGITGSKCDRCEPEYALVNKTCVSCKEGCYKLLWQRVDQMSGILDAFNISKVDTEPLKRLQKAEQRYKDAAEKAKKNRLQALKKLMEEAEKIKNEVGKKLNESAKLKNTSDSLREERCKIQNSLPARNKTLNDLRKEAQDIVNGLKKPVKIVSKQKDLLKKAREAIKNMMTVDATPPEKSMGDLKKLHDAIKKDLKDYLNGLKFPVINKTDTLKDLKKRLEDLQNVAIDIAKRLSPASVEYEKLKKQLASTSTAIDGLNKKIADIESSKKNSKDSNDGTEKILENIRANQATEKQIKKINDMIKKFNKEFDNNFAKSLDIQPAFNAILKLNKTKASLNDILKKNAEGTRAAMAYKDIIKAVKDADKSATNASDTVKNILEKIKGKKLSAEAKKVKKESDEAKTSLVDIGKKHKEQKDRINKLKARTDAVAKKVADQSKKIKNAKKGIDVKPITVKLNEISETQAKNRAELTNADNGLKNSQNDIKALQNRLKKLKSNSNADSGDLEKDVKDIEEKNTNMNKKLDSLSDAMKKLKQKLGDIKKKMGKVRELIEISHGQAAQDIAPYRIGGGCVRTYRTYYLEPSSFLNFRIWLRISSPPTEDQLIMFGKTPESEFFWSLEMTKESKLRLQWRSKLGKADYKVESNVKVAKKWVEVIAEIYPLKSVLKVRTLSKAKKPAEIDVQNTGTTFVKDIPWVTAKTIVYLGGFPDGEKPPSLLESVKPWVGCTFAMRINNRAFGPSDMMKVSSKCNIKANDQNPFARNAPCTINIDKLPQAYDNRFQITIPRYSSLSFYGDGYFKGQQYLNKGGRGTVFAKKHKFQLWPQPFMQTARTLVMVFLYEPAPSQINYVKVEFQKGKLYLEAREGIVTCTAESKEMKDFAFRGTDFSIDFSSPKLVLENLFGNCDKINGIEMFKKVTGIYVGGVPSYIREKFKSDSKPLGRNFYGCISFYYTTQHDLPSDHGPMRFLATPPTEPYGVTRNVEYNCPLKGVSPQPINHVSFSKKHVLSITDHSLINSWKSRQNVAFTFSTNSKGPYDLMEFLDKTGTKQPIKIGVKDSKVEVSIASSSRRVKRQAPNVITSTKPLKEGKSYLVSLRLLKKPLPSKETSVYLIVGDEQPINKEFKVDVDVASINIGQGTDGSKGDICYRGLVIGDEMVNFVSFDLSNPKTFPSGLNFLPCNGYGNGIELRMPEAVPVKTVSAASVSSRTFRVDILRKRYRDLKAVQCGSPPEFNQISSSYFMDLEKSRLQVNVTEKSRDFDIEFKFRTITTKNQTYLATARFSGGNSLILLIDRETPYLMMCKRKCFSKTLHVSVTSGYWHHVKLQRRGRYFKGVSFSIDDISVTISKRFNAKLLGVAFAGRHENLELRYEVKARFPQISHFGGCMKDIFINGDTLRKYRGFVASGISGRCYTCSSFAKYQAFKSLRSAPVRLVRTDDFKPTPNWKGGFMLISEIRPNLEEGIVFSIAERIKTSGRVYRKFRRLRWKMLRWRKRTKRATDNNALLVFVVYLRQGTIKHKLTIYDPISRSVTRGKTITQGSVKVNEWSKIVISEFKWKWETVNMKLKVDDLPAMEANTVELPTYFKKYDLQLGGHSLLSFNDWRAITKVSDSFTGCIRNLMVRVAFGRAEWRTMINKDLTDIKRLHINECPNSK